MNRYSKLIGALLGNLVAIIIAYMAVQFPSIATCVPSADPTLNDACSIAGFDQAQITGFLMLIFNSLFVYIFPPNRPPA